MLRKKYGVHVQLVRMEISRKAADVCHFIHSQTFMLKSLEACVFSRHSKLV